jgi:hypothetical protein
MEIFVIGFGRGDCIIIMIIIIIIISSSSSSSTSSSSSSSSAPFGGGGCSYYVLYETQAPKAKHQHKTGLFSSALRPNPIWS